MVLIVYMMEVSPPCRAVLMTIKYLGIPAELRVENMVIGSSKKHAEFRKINPRSCVPTIDDDGFYLWESRAIMTYLVNRYASSHAVYPRDPRSRARVDMMLSFDQGTLYKAMVDYLYPCVFRGESASSGSEAGWASALASLERALADDDFVAGNHLTLADISILASIALAEVYAFNFRPFPRIQQWSRRVKRELPFHRDVNETPLVQFKCWYRPWLQMRYEDTLHDDDDDDDRLIVTKM